MSGPTCPAPRSKLVELYFMEHRAKIIDIAAFLDRLDRAQDDTRGDDFRIAALRMAIVLLADGRPERARRVLELLSDRTTAPIQSAAGMKGAFGAPPGGRP